MLYRDRVDAGQRLARALLPLRRLRPVVLGLPRGGVPVAAEVARALGAPLDVLLVRKLGVPSQPELAMGAVGEGGVRVLDDRLVAHARVSPAEVEQVERRERAELERRAERLRAGRPAVSLAGRTALVVDDGLATGATARAACRVARSLGAATVVVAAPVGSRSAVERLRQEADQVLCPETPPTFAAVGEWYADFRATTDDEVERLLAAAHAHHAAVDDEVAVAVEGLRLPGRLVLPAGAPGVVVFAHGSGSSRHSPRNRAVAAALEQAGLGTLLLDLLSPAEEQDRRNVFDVALLGTRLTAVVRWLQVQPEAQGARVGLFGASTGAAAALWAAAELDGDVHAVVSRGGRPDLAGARLGEVRAPTLLVVGGRDEQVLELNRQAAACLRCEHELVVVPGATHLFAEPGALEQVAGLARGWFAGRLSPAPAGRP